MDAYEALRAAPYFASVASAKVAALARVTLGACVLPGERLMRAGDAQTHVLYVSSGRIALSRRNPKRGLTFLLGRVVAPSIVGDMERAVGAPWTVTGRAEVACTCLRLPNAAFDAFIRDEPALLHALYRDASVRHYLAHQSGEALALYDIETRFLRLLLDMADSDMTSDGSAYISPAPSQAELAARLCVHRRTVARTLARLLARGAVDTACAGAWRLPQVSRLRARMPAGLAGLSSQGFLTPRPLTVAPTMHRDAAHRRP